jgi:hypothetical protein
VGSLTSHKLIGLHGLLQGQLYYFVSYLYFTLYQCLRYILVGSNIIIEWRSVECLQGSDLGQSSELLSRKTEDSQRNSAGVDIVAAETLARNLPDVTEKSKRSEPPSPKCKIKSSTCCQNNLQTTEARSLVFRIWHYLLDYCFTLEKEATAFPETSVDFLFKYIVDGPRQQNHSLWQVLRVSWSCISVWRL